MTAADLWGAWRLWMGVGAAVVLVAAGLLVTIWLTARSIVGHANRALRAAEAIRDNTRPIWGLQTTDEVAEQILQTVQDIEATTAKLVETLTSHPATSGRR